MNGARFGLIAFSLLVGARSLAEPAEAQLTWARFPSLRALIVPRPEEEPWATVAWRSSLWEARREAARDNRPILLWQMSGNPLGCT